MSIIDGIRTVEIRDLTEDYEAGRSLVENFLHRYRVSDVVVSETMLIFEALCHNIFEQEGDDVVIQISGRRRFGSAGIILNFEGDMYVSDMDYPGEPTPEDMILTAFADRIDYIYRSRFNSIRIQARRSFVGAALAYLVAILIAVLVYAVIHSTVGAETEVAIRSNLLYPLETLFSNAVLMIGAPVTFLSLLKNLTGIYILSERDSGLRKITHQTLTSSCISVLLALVLSSIIGSAAIALGLSVSGGGEMRVHMLLSEFIEGLLPADILTPFQTISPFPLILLAALVTYAFCSVGKYFDKMMDAINVCYALFARMLAIVMYTLPTFTLCAVLDCLLKDGYSVLWNGIIFILLILASLIIPAVYYAIRLAARNVSIPEFVRRLGPLLAENFKIASAIEAVPFNIRYCMKNYGIDRKSLESAMPVLAQVNLDGNCYLLTLIAIAFMRICSPGVPLGDMILIGMLVFVLSLGAPNQPGSCIIGTLIILHYVHAYTLIPFAILAEVLFGTALNLMNVTGDIVTITAYKQPDFQNK